MAAGVQLQHPDVVYIFGLGPGNVGHVEIGSDGAAMIPDVAVRGSCDVGVAAGIDRDGLAIGKWCIGTRRADHGGVGQSGITAGGRSDFRLRMRR